MKIPHIERTSGARRVTWYTVLGILLIPIAVGGLLLWSLYDPTARLHTATAAIVNNDEPVKIDGKLTPMGRQLAAELVHQSSTGEKLENNYNWVITTEDDASAGLADGTYQAVVTIPKGFSEAATSVQSPASARTATVNVQTSDHSGIAESAIGAAITNTASTVFGREVSKTYLDNIYLGFNTLHSQLAKARDGAADLKSGANRAHDGATQLAAGAKDAESGAGQLVNGLSQLSSATAQLTTGAQQVSSGANQVASGSNQLATGLDTLAAGAAKTNKGAQQVAAGNAQLAGKSAQATSAFDAVAAKVTSAPDFSQQTKDLANRANTASQAAGTVANGSAQTTQELKGLAADCEASGGSTEYCARVSAAATASQNVSSGAQQVATTAGQVSKAAGEISTVAPKIRQGVADASTAVHQLNDATQQLATGSAQVAQGTSQLATGSTTAARNAHQLATGANQVSTGAAQLYSGAKQVQAGTNEAYQGAVSLDKGLKQLSTGADQLVTGTSQLATGASKLRDGLADAVSQVPTYTAAERTKLADTVTNPVGMVGSSLDNVFGGAAMPFLTAISLWVGALALFLVLRPITRTALTSSDSLAKIMARTGVPAVVIGAGQGILIAIIAQFVLGLEPAAWLAFAGISVLSAVAFTLVMQGLVSLLRGTGTFIAVVAAAISIGAGIFSTAPGIVQDLAGILPISSASNALIPVASGLGNAGSGIMGLFVWSLVGLALTATAVTRQRSIAPSAFARGWRALPA